LWTKPKMFRLVSTSKHRCFLTPRMGPYTRVVTEPLEIPSGFPGDAENATSWKYSRSFPREKTEKPWDFRGFLCVYCVR
jgi:hypothetical protein